MSLIVYQHSSAFICHGTFLLCVFGMFENNSASAVRGISDIAGIEYLMYRLHVGYIN